MHILHKPKILAGKSKQHNPNVDWKWPSAVVSPGAQCIAVVRHHSLQKQQQRFNMVQHRCAERPEMNKPNTAFQMLFISFHHSSSQTVDPSRSDWTGLGEAGADADAFGQALLQLSQIASFGSRVEIRGSCASTTEAQQQLGALVSKWKPGEVLWKRPAEDTH